MIGAPLIRWLLSIYSKVPEYLGAEPAVALITEGGRRFAETAAGKVEVVIASAKQASSIGSDNLAGVYVVGTGDTGAASTFVTLGVVYFIVMMIASFMYRVPAEDWKPEGWNSEELTNKKW